MKRCGCSGDRLFRSGKLRCRDAGLLCLLKQLLSRFVLTAKLQRTSGFHNDGPADSLTMNSRSHEPLKKSRRLLGGILVEALRCKLLDRAKARARLKESPHNFFQSRLITGLPCFIQQEFRFTLLSSLVESWVSFDQFFQPSPNFLPHAAERPARRGQRIDGRAGTRCGFNIPENRIRSSGKNALIKRERPKQLALFLRGHAALKPPHHVRVAIKAVLQDRLFELSQRLGTDRRRRNSKGKP